MLFLDLFLQTRFYGFRHHTVGGQFWLLALVVSVLVGGVVLYFALLRPRSQGKSVEGVLGVVLAVFVSFLFVQMTASHLNYALDTAPVSLNATVTGEEYRGGFRGPDTFVFTIEMEDGSTYDLKVPRRAYRSYAVGDTLPVSRYEGALGEPFYLYESRS